LDQFASATGLVINFSKSTMVPMHVGTEVVGEIQAILGCRLEGFPQMYLGLPLTCDKLKLCHFAPLIASIDKYLSGWASLLLSSGGRITLLNAVLDALPAYAMGAIELPPALLRAIDALRRAFLWNFSGRASGGNCLVAW
jgi:mannosylglycoprotein endo-beta-mannosidase